MRTYIEQLCIEMQNHDPKGDYDASVLSMDDIADDVADQFCDVLGEWLTPTQLEEVRQRNAAETDAVVCHSHDFCDANEAMLQALQRLGIRYRFAFNDNDQPDEFHDECSALMTKAWDKAKARGFHRLAFTH